MSTRKFSVETSKPILWIGLLVLYLLALSMRIEVIDALGGQDYISWAQKNYFGGITPGYLQFADQLTQFRYSNLAYPPGYPGFLAFLKLLGISDLQWMRVVQAGIDSFGVLLVYSLLRRVGVVALVAISAAMIYAIYPLWVAGSTFLLAEFSSPLFMLSALLLIIKCDERSSKSLILVCGLFLGIAALIRPDFLLLPGALAVWMLWRHFNRSTFVAAALLVAGFAIPITLWGTHNKLNHGHWVFSSTGGGVGLWEGLGEIPNDYGYVLSDQKTVEMLQLRGLKWHSVEADQYLKAEYLKAWIEHPEFVVKVIIKRWAHILLSSESWLAEIKPLDALRRTLDKWGIGLVLIALRLYRSSPVAVLVLALPIAYALISIGMTHWEPRYVRYVHLSYVFSIALILNWIVHKISHGSTKAAAVLSSVTLLATIWLATNALMTVTESAAASQLAVTLPEKANRGELVGGYDLCALKFSAAVKEAAISRDQCRLHLVTSKDPYAYQATSVISIPQGSALYAKFEGRLESGGINIGLLSGDGSRFLAQSTYEKVGEYSGELTVGAGRQTQVVVVISNSNSKGLPSKASLAHFVLKCYPIECSPQSARDLTSSVSPASNINFLLSPSELNISQTEAERLIISLPPALSTQLLFTAENISIDEEGIHMQGKAQTPYSYLAQLPPEKVSGKRLLIAEGDLYKGGLTLGLLKNNQWAGQINVTQPGRFIAVLEAADDTYTPTLANNVPGTDGTNHFRISKIGWVDHLQ